MNLERALQGEPEYRIKQVKKLVFHDLIENWDKATNLPLSLRERLKKEASLATKAKIFESKNKKDNKSFVRA